VKYYVFRLKQVYYMSYSLQDAVFAFSKIESPQGFVLSAACL